jgi:hydroxyacyl-ACP dehydratase HTD2-like protein with hotdog domain
VTSEMPQATAGTVIAERRVRPSEVELFMFSAATWLTHRIHFDRDYARTEGHRDLVVHGPLQGAYLAGLLSDLADQHGGQLTRLAYRHHRPAYCGELLIVQAALTSVTEQADGFEVELAVRIRCEDVLVTSGLGLLRFPGRPAVTSLLAGGGTET